MDHATRPTADRLHVVLLCAPARVGGLERVVQLLARVLAGRGHRVTVVACVADRADVEPFVAPMRGTAIEVEVLRFGARDYARERRTVRALLASLKPDVLHTHGYRSDLMHGGPARAAGIATVSTVHGSSRMGGLTHLLEWVQLRALRLFDAVIPVSAPLARALAGAGVRPARLHLVPNAIGDPGPRLSRDEARRMLGVADDGAVVLGWVGRLVAVKAADVFLRALATLPRGDWQAVLVGDGPLRAELTSQASRLGLADRVRFAGEVDDASRLLAGFDGFVLSSHSEGTPIAVLEAMVAGLPVIATSVGGVPDLVGGEAAWLVPPADPGALAAAIEALLADPAGAARRGVALGTRARTEFDPQRWAERHEAIYREAMVTRRGGR